MLTPEENEMFTRVGPGTPGGELLRRYWHPIAIATDLTEEKPASSSASWARIWSYLRTSRARRSLGRPLRAPRRIAILRPRRRARHRLLLSRLALRHEGNCLECPAEPKASNFHLTVKQRAYPAQEFAGLYWAYMGPQPAPVISKYDVWARTDGWHWIRALPTLDCNWLQAMENSVDTTHLHILHQELVTDGFTVRSTTRGTIDDLEKYEFTTCRTAS
jgi:5,5'-dehydrodivanillate O-demethylase